jgi:hypothetical protein
MTRRPRSTPPRTPRAAQGAALTLLAAGFAAALLPLFHWSLGTAATVMTYLVGTAALITAGIVAVYYAGGTADGAADAEGDAQ